MSQALISKIHCTLFGQSEKGEWVQWMITVYIPWWMLCLLDESKPSQTCVTWNSKFVKLRRHVFEKAALQMGLMGSKSFSIIIVPVLSRNGNHLRVLWNGIVLCVKRYFIWNTGETRIRSPLLPYYPLGWGLPTSLQPEVMRTKTSRSRVCMRVYIKNYTTNRSFCFIGVVPFNSSGYHVVS